MTVRKIPSNGGKRPSADLVELAADRVKEALPTGIMGLSHIWSEENRTDIFPSPYQSGIPCIG